MTLHLGSLLNARITLYHMILLLINNCIHTISHNSWTIPSQYQNIFVIKSQTTLKKSSPSPMEPHSSFLIHTTYPHIIQNNLVYSLLHHTIWYFSLEIIVFIQFHTIAVSFHHNIKRFFSLNLKLH